MNKSTIIAKCLVNSNMISDLDTAESSIKSIFIKEFPNLIFNQWNRDVPNEVARNIIDNVGRASRINVKKFIIDLMDNGN